MELLELLLSHHGVTVLKAYGGQESLEVVRREPVDLVVLDVMMPGTESSTLGGAAPSAHSKYQAKARLTAGRSVAGSYTWYT